MTIRVVINQCYGGFGISDKAYEKLIEWGIPVVKYDEVNWKIEGPVIFAWPDEKRYLGKYWDTWLKEDRSHPLLLRLMDELGSEVISSNHAELIIIEIPDNVKWHIEEYGGIEHIAEDHRTWP